MKRQIAFVLDRQGNPGRVAFRTTFEGNPWDALSLGIEYEGVIVFETSQLNSVWNESFVCVSTGWYHFVLFDSGGSEIARSKRVAMIAGDEWFRLLFGRMFNTTTLSASGINVRVTESAARAAFFKTRQWSRVKSPSTRAINLMLHWWAVGHDPGKHLLRCEECRGCGMVVGYIGAPDCHHCGGTGRTEEKKL